MAKTTVLYIAGWGRSGSTILGNILGQLPGFFHTGELAHLWQRAIVEDAMCGCGLAFSECPVWGKVLNDAFGGSALATARRMLDLRATAIPTHRELFLSTVMPHAAALLGRSGQAEFGQTLDRLYAAIAHQGEGRIIVDSSKTPSYLYALGQVANLDIRVVHLVRDPRATTYSWLRKIERTDAKGKLAMEQFPVWGSASRWVTWNAVVPVVADRIGVPVMRLHYEDFVANPRAILRKVLSMVDDVRRVPDSALPFVGPKEVELGQTHTVWGNPSRQRTGRVQIRPDSEWSTSLSATAKAMVTGLTYPLARHYGYFAGSKHEPAHQEQEHVSADENPAPPSR